MSEINVNTAKLKSYSTRLKTVENKLRVLNEHINRSYKSFGLLGILNLINKGPSMKRAADQIGKSSAYAWDTAVEFEKVENQLLTVDDTVIRAIQYIEKIVQIINGKTTVGSSESVVEPFYKRFWNGEVTKEDHVQLWEMPGSTDENFFRFGEAGYALSLTPSVLTYESDDAVGEHFHITHDQEKKNGKQVNEKENFYDKKGTIAEAKAEAKVEASLIHEKVEGKAKYASGSMEAKVLTAEAHANAAAGLYVYEKDKDGKVKRIFSPGVSAEVGASVAAFELTGEGRIGLGEDNNMLGAYGDFDVKAYSAEATAKVAFNRKEIYAGASAEADLVKVSGTAGVSVLGTDIGVTGSLKVGVGAHANVGYTDGKLKVDVGAAVGVGFDLGFEVDVKGTVDAVVKNGDKIVKAVSSGAKSVYEGGKKLWKSIFG